MDLPPQSSKNGDADCSAGTTAVAFRSRSWKINSRAPRKKGGKEKKQAKYNGVYNACQIANH
jgi:hypothetical protein